MSTIKVLIIDDSALIRELMTELLGSDPGIEVVGTAADPFIAREKIKQLTPDVITLDIEMPKMDGLTFLERVMALRPMPVIVVSTMTQKGSDAAVRALELGAVDVVAKPLRDIREGMAHLRAEVIAKVRAAATTRPVARTPPTQRAPLKIDPNLSAERKIVAIGASTGGVEALQSLLSVLPPTAPAVVITQHMPAGFTTSFARRLDERCHVTVCEAADGQRILPGHVYISNGRQHLAITKSGAQYFCHLEDGPLVSGHRPSVDVLFRSFAAHAGNRAMGIILTGMGRDGAAGLLDMRRAGARTLGQSEASCLIYGMPKVAREMDAVDAELPLEKLAAEIIA